MFLSVVICTHNPRESYLHRVLASLRAQTLEQERWELLLVDNRSEHRLADRWQLSWHGRARCVREEELGLTAARLRAITEAAGDLLVFLDDDNVIAADFLEQVQSIAVRFPHVGVIGAGKIEPEFEIEPPRAVASRLRMLALRNVTRPLWSNEAHESNSIPWGAGMAVRRNVAEVFRDLVESPSVREVIGRRGQRLFAGEDDLFSWSAVAAGYGFGVFPQLRLTHLIPAKRLSVNYFLKLVHDHSYSHCVLGHLLGLPGNKRTVVSRGARLALQGYKEGAFGVRCQLAAFRGQDAAERFIAESGVARLRLPGIA